MANGAQSMIKGCIVEANKATNDDFNWDNVSIKSAD